MTAHAAEYSTDITHKPTRAGRMGRGEYTGTVTTPDGETITQPGFWTRGAAEQWAQSYVEDHRSGRIAARAAQQAARRATEQAATVPAPAPARDRTADRVGSLIGAPAAKATGRCHYCGLPLNRRGYCEECV